MVLRVAAAVAGVAVAGVVALLVTVHMFVVDVC